MNRKIMQTMMAEKFLNRLKNTFVNIREAQQTLVYLTIAIR